MKLKPYEHKSKTVLITCLNRLVHTKHGTFFYGEKIHKTCHWNPSVSISVCHSITSPRQFIFLWQEKAKHFCHFSQPWLSCTARLLRCKILDNYWRRKVQQKVSSASVKTQQAGGSGKPNGNVLKHALERICPEFSQKALVFVQLVPSYCSRTCTIMLSNLKSTALRFESSGTETPLNTLKRTISPHAQGTTPVAASSRRNIALQFNIVIPPSPMLGNHPNWVANLIFRL